MTVNHTIKIIGSTLGQPATLNDKTIILFDKFIRGVNNGKYYSDNTLKFFERDNGNIAKREYKGVWFMVDNVYFSWQCTVPPFKMVSYKNIFDFQNFWNPYVKM